MKLITKGRVIGTIVILAIVALVWGGNVLQKKFMSADDKPRYKTSDVDRGSIVQFVTATGTLNPVGLVNVGTQVLARSVKSTWISTTG